MGWALAGSADSGLDSSGDSGASFSPLPISGKRELDASTSDACSRMARRLAPACFKSPSRLRRGFEYRGDEVFGADVFVSVLVRHGDGAFERLRPVARVVRFGHRGAASTAIRGRMSPRLRPRCRS